MPSPHKARQGHATAQRAEKEHWCWIAIVWERAQIQVNFKLISYCFTHSLHITSEGHRNLHKAKSHTHNHISPVKQSGYVKSWTYADIPVVASRATTASLTGFDSTVYHEFTIYWIKGRFYILYMQQIHRYKITAAAAAAHWAIFQPLFRARQHP